jgi:hypothetical protein
LDSRRSHEEAFDTIVIMTASFFAVMMPHMTRTTVTLDPDVEQLLRDAMQRRRQSFKEALNQAIRNGLADLPAAEREGRFKVRARSMGLRAGVDPARLNQLADEMEVDAFLALSAKLAQPKQGPGRRKPR